MSLFVEKDTSPKKFKSRFLVILVVLVILGFFGIFNKGGSRMMKSAALLHLRQ